MITSDCHIHSSFSSDSDTDMEDMIKSAIKNNLTTICFTEHMDYNFPDMYELDFVFNPDEYFDRLDKLIPLYSDYINILKGVEIGLAPDTEEQYNSLLNDYPWDYVIGSTHIVDGLDPYYREYWDNGYEKDLIKHYFDVVYSNIKRFKDFDSLGHLDYILRYAPDKNTSFYYTDYSNIIDKILMYIIEHNIALEINSSGYRSGLNDSNPCDDIIRRYMELGGRLITIGSDAHNTDYIAGYFDAIYDKFNNLGIHEYTIYKNRTPYLYHV